MKFLSNGKGSFQSSFRGLQPLSCYRCVSMVRRMSKYEKAFRAEILAGAVEQLRGELRFSRKELAAAVGDGLDVSMIGKWERGQFSPSPKWRRRLAVFARRRGCYGQAAAFEQPLQQWRDGRDFRKQAARGCCPPHARDLSAWPSAESAARARQPLRLDSDGRPNHLGRH